MRWGIMLLTFFALARGGDALHLVRPGDTAWKIARFYGVSPVGLARLAPDPLPAGGWLRVPGGFPGSLPPGAYGVWRPPGQRVLEQLAGGARGALFPLGSSGWWVVVPEQEQRSFASPAEAARLAGWRGVRSEELRPWLGRAAGRVWIPWGRFLLRWPTAGVLTSGYGYRQLRVAGSNFHRGIDLAPGPGAPVWAPRGGVAVAAGWDRWLGWRVVLDHGDGWRTVYGHLSRVAVRVGQRVRLGDLIGRVGATGIGARGPHLHFELRRDGRSVDPIAHLPPRRTTRRGP